MTDLRSNEEKEYHQCDAYIASSTASRACARELIQVNSRKLPIMMSQARSIYPKSAFSDALNPVNHMYQQHLRF
jgi:hypothetical protein